MIYKMTLTDSADSMTMDLLEVPIADTDVEGAVDNTTIDGNVFTDYLWLKKKYVQKWSIMCPDEYDRLRGFYTRQWANASPAQYRLFYGENIFTDYSESGDYIVVNNSSDISAPVTNFAMYGDATQTTYSGKNLFSGQWSQFDNTGGSGSVYGYFQLPTNGDYTMTLIAKSSIATQTTSRYIGFTTYGGEAGNSVKWVYSGTPSSTAGQVRSYNNTYTGGNHGFISIYPKTEETLQWFINNFDIQLEQGSTATSYEPYVGGIPAPNPDYPQEIHTVTGENTLKIVGKNLFDINSLAQGGISVVDGVAIATASNFHASVGWNTNGVKLPFIPSGRVTITATAWTNGNASTAQNVGLAFRIYYTDGAYESINFDNNLTSPTTKTFVSNASKTIEKVCITYGNTGSNVWQLTKVQIEEGTTSTEFEDFSEQDAPITLTSKNLFGGLSFYTSSNVASYDFTDGILTITPTSASLNPNISFTLEKPIQAQTVHLSNNGISPSTATQLRDSSNNIVGNFGSSYDSTKTLSDVACRITFNWASTGSTEPFSSDLTKMQIEYGSSASSYTPYLNIRLAKLGTFKDRINYDGVKWWLHKEINKWTFSGNEGWQLRNTQANGVVTYSWSFTNAPEYYHSASATGEWKCSYLTNLGSTSGVTMMYSKGVGFCPYYNNTQPTTVSLYLNTMDSTLNDFKKNIAGNEILYPIATPTDTEITDSNLLSQLNAIYELYVKSGQNSIIIIPTSPNLQPDFDIGYRVFSEQETDIVSIVPVRLGLTDDGVINTCGCRRNIQLTMRETIQ